MRYLTPLRYPGGKAKLASFVRAVVSTNGLTNGHYVEPYAGGAGIACALLVGNDVAHIHVNDLDRSIYAFWHSVLNETDRLCRRIRDVRLSIEEWRRQRAIQSRPDNVSLLDLGFSALFLNRTNRSGIICSGGVIGGIDQSGKWKLDARFPRDGLITRIQTIAAYRHQITLYNCDAAILLRTLLPRLPAKSLLYLDPPYYVKGNRRLYANVYEHADHAEIAKILSRARCSWLVSYDDVPQIRALYRRRRRRLYSLTYTARDRYQGAEIVFSSDDLVLPSIRNPLKIAQRIRGRDGLREPRKHL
ncbi:MAG: DNA adenine methylase [Candidatus Rokuibacteriota bacterium]